MSQAFGVSLAANISVVADQPAVYFPGGRGVIATDGTTWPTTCQVQLQLRNGSWVSIGSNLTAAGISSELALPAGQYRVHMTGGTAAAVYVDLARVPY
jgi:hypothetical protein